VAPLDAPTSAVARWAGRGTTRRMARHDAEDAGGPDEELLGVQAGVVLAQGGHEVQHRAVREDDLDSEEVLPHVAVAQHARPGGIGGHHASPRRIGAEVDGEEQPVFGQGGVELAEQDSASGEHGAVDGIDLELLGEPLQAEDDHAPARVRGGRAHQSRIRSLWDDAEAARGGEGEHARDVLRPGRAHHGQGGAAAVTPALLVAGPLVRLGHDGVGAEEGGQLARHLRAVGRARRRLLLDPALAAHAHSPG
jgi:hypothetical protein